MGKETMYSSKLKDPRWQKLRLKVMERDGFKCKLCRDEKTTLNIHHEEYFGEPWEAPIEKLHTYCEDCHIAVELWKHELIENKPLKSLKLESVNKKEIAIAIKISQGILLSNTTRKIAVISLANETIESMHKLVKDELNG